MKQGIVEAWLLGKGFTITLNSLEGIHPLSCRFCTPSNLK
jgi:hypothetical protein